MRGNGTVQYTGYAPTNAVPPPSDYFLGFRSAGTQIWSRLRQAGLETQRIYALDTKRVMIKIRCPTERLQDVAEVLRLKLKTKDGVYTPFRESIISQFVPTDDGFPSQTHCRNASSLFRSSERQAIIDFVIRSRIRDSGAELGQRTDLGKQIEMRVPLHMHARLEALYSTWVLYWQPINWVGRDGKSMAVSASQKGSVTSLRSSTSSSNNVSQTWVAMSSSNTEDDSQKAKEEEHSHPPSTRDSPPSFLRRFFVGSFYQPLDSIEQYFGEKVAFYFAWLQHCSFHLVFLSLVGLVVFLCQVLSGDFDHPVRPFFSVIVMLWSFVVMVTWRQRSNFLAHRWGTLNYREEETTRPQFKGEYRQSEITQEWVVHYPSWKRWLKYCISLPLTAAFTVVSLLGILIVYANRDIMLARYFEDADDKTFKFDLSIHAIGQRGPMNAVDLSEEHLRDPQFWLVIIGFPALLGLCLPLLNFLLMRVSIWLNEFENYRTETEYRNHLIIKVFSFRFVCYFAALYYYSFVSISTDKQVIENGILRVATSLFVYLTVAHWWTICLTIYFPLLFHRWRIYRERLNLRDEVRRLQQMEEEASDLANSETLTDKSERQKMLVNRRLLLEQAQSSIWEEMMLREHDSFPEYVLAVIQFAYVTCFSVVLPITPLIVLVNHLLSMRLDAYKLCRGRRRPLAQKTGGIGVWEHVLHIVTVIAVLTNCSLMALTSSQFLWIAEQIGTLGLFVLTVGWEHIMLLIKYVMQSSFSKMPKSVMDAIKKQQYQMARKRNSNLRAKKNRRSSSTQNVPTAVHASINKLNNTKAISRMRDNGINNGFSKGEEESSPLTVRVNSGLSTIPSMSDTEESPLLQERHNSWALRHNEQNENRSHRQRISAVDPPNSYGVLDIAASQKRADKLNRLQERERSPSKKASVPTLTPMRSNRSRRIPSEELSVDEKYDTIDQKSEIPFEFFPPRYPEASAPPMPDEEYDEDYSVGEMLLSDEHDEASLDSLESNNVNSGDVLSPFARILDEEKGLIEDAFAEERIRKRLSTLDNQEETKFVQSRRRQRKKRGATIEEEEECSFGLHVA